MHPQPAALSPALEMHHISKAFGDLRAVDDVSLTMQRGELLALLGPNGAGKTTTISMCEGFLTPDSGELKVLGLDPTQQRDELRSRIGIMLQSGGSYSGIRVGEQLRLSASYYANPLDIEWLAELLGLKRIWNTTYRRLSGGQKQRLSLALALVGRPELVFLDEPTAGMDAQSRHLVWQLIRQLKADGVSVVLTTHFMQEAQTLADRVAIMDHGQIVALDTPQALCNSSMTQGAQIHTNAALDLGAIHQATGLRLEDRGELRYVLQAEITPQLLADLAAAALSQDVMINSWQTNERTLEDVFLDLTGRHLATVPN